MKKVVLSFILSLVAINLFADIKGFEAKEIYIGYFLSDNYANVIEYDIQYDKNQKKIKEDINSLIETIQKNEYAKKILLREVIFLRNAVCC